jgi:hypothetical protein
MLEGDRAIAVSLTGFLEQPERGQGVAKNPRAPQIGLQGPSTLSGGELAAADRTEDPHPVGA